MTGSAHRLCAVRAEEDAGALRRTVTRMTAGQGGLRPGVAELVATELGTNLVRHTRDGGYVLVRTAGDGIELISVDRGPGMPPGALTPATTAAGPPARGRGLNAGLNVVRRHAAEFDCYTTRGGTVVYARLGTTDPHRAGRWRFGAVNVPYGGDGESGDAWAVLPDGRLAALVVDGLGHGPAAAAASRAAVAVFERGPVTDLEALIKQAHEAMRATRGGVLGACLVDPGRGELTYAAVGNITGRLLAGGRAVHLLDRPGTLGTHLPLPTVRPQTCPWEHGATLVLASDGLRSGWNLDEHPRLLEHHPAVIAAVLHRDHGRPTDDATVLVVQGTAGTA
ncbi:SpoIIE family protein phosphatase [Streptomyces sp. TRM68416]|uniref:SpoIIE family protein phosphatase n=1 Tax=Streptomyces sp. TRM68416 TaxID=2758412 RepID=UPI002948BDC6|nr:SpoIIE family protein phosphatase [Streptomyces sp. TRM68416]